MTPLDQALSALYEDPENNENRYAFYSLFLNTNFMLPVFDEETGGVAKEDKGEKALPLIMEADGNNYMMIFENQQRVDEWSEEGAFCVSLPGHVIVQMATEDLYLAMNVGTEYNKQFVPEEIAWLKDVVKQSKEEPAAE